MTNDRSPVPQPAPELPLGIQQPFLPPATLGQSLLQPKFLTPLGARSLSILDPAIFLSGQNADLPAWESPFQDSPFFDPPDTRSPAAPAPAVQTKPQSQPAAPNPTRINSLLNPSIESAAPLESVANFSPLDFPFVDPAAAPEFSEPTFAPLDSISEPEATLPPTIAPEATVQRSPENLPGQDAIASEATVQRSPQNSPGSDFAEATVQRSPENSPGSDFLEATVQRSSENSLGSEAIVPSTNPQFDPPDRAPETPQPTLTESPAAIDLPATVQRSPENPSPETVPVPASETAAISLTLAAETPSQAALAETVTSSSPVEPERSTAPESIAPSAPPPSPAPIQRVETLEPAAPAIEPILAEDAIAPEPIGDTDLAPAIQTKLEPTVRLFDSPIAQPVSNFLEPTIAQRAAGEPSLPAPPPQERGAGEEVVSSEVEQSSGEEILSDSAMPEAVEPPSLVIEAASIAASPSFSSSEPESTFSTNSEIESTARETVQRSVTAPETSGFEPENSVEAIASSTIDDRTDALETVQRKVEQPKNLVETIASETVNDPKVSAETVQREVEQPENSVETIASETVDDRTNSAETVQRKIEASAPAETRSEEFNPALVEPNRAIDAPESMAETVAQASSLPGQDAAPTSEGKSLKAQENRSIESNSAQNQSIETRFDSLETPAESLPQVDPIEPAQNPAIVPLQIQTLAEATPNLPQPQPETSSNFSSIVPSEIVSSEITSEVPVNPVIETENISLQPIQLEEAEDQQDQSPLAEKVNHAEDIAQVANGAETVVQPKVQEQSIAPNSITPVEPSEAISQPSIHLETEKFPSEQIVSPVELEASPAYSQESDRTEQVLPSTPPPIPENLSLPIQRKTNEANSSETSSIVIPEAEPEPEPAIAQSLSESSITIAQNPAPSIERLEAEPQPSPIDEIVPSPTATIEPQLQRSTSETERLTEPSTSEIEPPQQFTSEVQPRATEIELPLQRSTSETELFTSEIEPPLTSEVQPRATEIELPLQRSTSETELSTPEIDPPQQSTSEIQPTDEISPPSALRRESETFPEAEPETSLPELPTVIQKLSVLEPIAQMKPLYSSTDSATVPPSQAARSMTIPEMTIPEMQVQQFDRLFDLPSEPPSVMRKSDRAAPDSAPVNSPVTTEWANIAELFEASEETPASPEPSSNGSSKLNSEFNDELELNRELNGYSDLNLSSTNAAPSDVIQAKPERVGDLPNSEALINPSDSPNLSQAEASPEQLERLAQEIYHLVRQRLALERERFGKTGSGRSF